MVVSEPLLLILGESSDAELRTSPGRSGTVQAKGVPLGYGAVVLCRADNKEMGKQPIIVVDKISKCASYFLSMQC